MYIVQSVFSGEVWVCPRIEAWFWAAVNEDHFLSLQFNIYKQGGSMSLLSASEIIYDHTL
mgnify:CR=1 FL=1